MVMPRAFSSGAYSKRGVRCEWPDAQPGAHCRAQDLVCALGGLTARTHSGAGDCAACGALSTGHQATHCRMRCARSCSCWGAPHLVNLIVAQERAAALLSQDLQKHRPLAAAAATEASAQRHGSACEAGHRQGARGRTLVMAAVSVVLPWSTWPIVPMFRCGFARALGSYDACRADC